MVGYAARNAAIWVDSAVDTGGWGVMKVTWQLWDDSMATRRSVGVKWPIPEAESIAMCGDGCWLSLAIDWSGDRAATDSAAMVSTDSDWHLDAASKVLEIRESDSKLIYRVCRRKQLSGSSRGREHTLVSSSARSSFWM
nr:hypothetical protein [Tanacetum cinerariifolium]